MTYLLVPADRNSAGIAAAGDGQVITVEVATDRARAWADSDEVGFSGDEPLQVGPLAVLIEKDFTCITPRAGDEELDTYPNPNAGIG